MIPDDSTDRISASNNVLWRKPMITRGGNAMKGYLYTGKLVYVDTDQGKIGVLEKEDDYERVLIIDERTEYDTRGGWQNMMGSDVEVVVVDGKVTRVDYVVEED
jgi:hypothetical protein